MLDLVRRKPSSVQEIADQLPISRPAVWQHLKILKDAGVVTSRPVGTRGCTPWPPMASRCFGSGSTSCGATRSRPSLRSPNAKPPITIPSIQEANHDHDHRCPPRGHRCRNTGAGVRPVHQSHRRMVAPRTPSGGLSGGRDDGRTGRRRTALRHLRGRQRVGMGSDHRLGSARRLHVRLDDHRHVAAGNRRREGITGLGVVHRRGR